MCQNSICQPGSPIASSRFSDAEITFSFIKVNITVKVLAVKSLYGLFCDCNSVKAYYICYALFMLPFINEEFNVIS